MFKWLMPVARALAPVVVLPLIDVLSDALRAAVTRRLDGEQGELPLDGQDRKL